jgi:hypothetical protein
MTPPRWKYGKPLSEKIFGGMAQGDNKTGQKGTNSIFVMTCAEIFLIPADRTLTYARLVINFHPQKLDLHQIRITGGATSSIMILA